MAIKMTAQAGGIGGSTAHRPPYVCVCALANQNLATETEVSSPERNLRRIPP